MPAGERDRLSTRFSWRLGIVVTLGAFLLVGLSAGLTGQSGTASAQTVVASASWEPLGQVQGRPIVSVYGLTVSPQRHTLYAATHGRGIYTVQLPPS